MRDAPYCVVFITAPDAKGAEKLGKLLLERKLAACVNRVPSVASQYWWKGKIEKAEEHLLVLKTRTALLPVITQCVKENHPYDVPEVIALPILGGNSAYLEWVGANCQFTKPPERTRPPQ